jgi:hypothetical protein
LANTNTQPSNVDKEIKAIEAYKNTSLTHDIKLLKHTVLPCIPLLLRMP